MTYCMSGCMMSPWRHLRLVGKFYQFLGSSRCHALGTVQIGGLAADLANTEINAGAIVTPAR